MAYQPATATVDGNLYLTVPAEWKSAADVAKDVYKLWTQIDNFAKNFRSPAATSDADPLEALLLNKQHAQTVRYIGCLALATKDGLAGWRGLLTERRSLQALISACIGQSLLEHVLDQPWIGVDSESEELFAVSDRDAQEVDAFFRREQHALHSEQCNAGASSMRSPQLQAFKTATYRLSARIWRLLEPLYQLGQPSHEFGKWPSKKLMLGLHSIVETAAHLSRQMRLYPLCIFEWIPAGKGLKFSPDSMDAVNVGEMLETSPYIKLPDARRAVLRDGADTEHSQPLSLVAIYPGLRMHFREHGPPVHSLKDRLGPMDYECEMATQLICKSVVLLHWGKVSLAVELMGDGTWREAAEKGDLSEFAKDREGCVELGELFLQIHGRDAFVQ